MMTCTTGARPRPPHGPTPRISLLRTCAQPRTQSPWPLYIIASPRPLGGRRALRVPVLSPLRPTRTHRPASSLSSCPSSWSISEMGDVYDVVWMDVQDEHASR
ncbi:hypothetical protein C8Q77DRAFT_763699 [Trametes polyzona]|nr:hypothetical protein C8Q77DRAFT_763699 [Trametes polyzona]